jgi:hypothetical protein
MADIRAFKLRTGEEFVAQIIKITENEGTEIGEVYHIDNAVVPREQMGPDGQPSLGFALWCSMYGDHKHKIHEQDLLFKPGPTDENLGNAYKQLFKIGVITPVGPTILTG